MGSIANQRPAPLNLGSGGSRGVMTQMHETRPLGAAGFGNSSLHCERDDREVIQNGPARQAEIRDPRAVREARLWLIREELYGDFDEIRIFGERGLRALEVENDLDMGRAFDQAVKHFRAVAANLKDLVVALEERRRAC
jgi:hypothetical protein